MDIDVAAPRGFGPDTDAIETAAEFSRAMQDLRERSGLTIREVAKQCDRPAATIGDYFSGAHLPNDRNLLAEVLTACGEDQERIERWQLALTRARRRPRRRGTNPYRGLARFEASDAKWFFGREDVISLLLTHATAPSDLPLLLIGPSGAGKSSVLRAGLMPRLAEQTGGCTASVYDLTVTGVTELADIISQLTAEPVEHDGAAGGGQTVVVVDQFEAIFTLCDDEHERSRLIGALCELARGSLVVLALRADFYGLAIRYPGLQRALQDRQVVLGPMTAQQVRSAVVEPAQLARVGVDRELVALLLDDLAPADSVNDAAYESGALPLLSHALLATWDHSHGEMLTVSDYLASGGIKDALTRTAEQAYESLTADQQHSARQLFLRLVHVSEEMAPSRASVALGDLPGSTGGGDAEQVVLATFVRERMITVDADAAQITHDALLSAWPRLRSWIKADIERLRDRSRILAGAQAWALAEEEDAQLWRGSRLELAQEWATAAGNRATLSDQALAFVDACVAAANATSRAARRRTRRLQSTVVVLTALVVAVAALSIYSSVQREAARAAVGRAVTAANMADSNDVAFTADQLRTEDPAVAAQLSVSADEFARTPQAAASLLESSGAASVTRILDSAGIVQWVAVSPDRRLLAAAGDDGTLRLWNVIVPGHPTLVSDLVTADGEPLYAAEFSPDGKLLAAGGANGLVRMWDVSGAGAVPVGQPLSGTAGNVFSLAFSPDSATLAAASANGTVRLWHVSASARPTADGAPLVISSTYPNSVAFSPDGETLAAGTEAGTVWLWHLPGAASKVRAAPVPLAGMPLRGPGGPVSGIAFSPDGRELAASSKDFKVWLWRVAGRRAAPAGTLTGATNWVNTVAFSPDGKSVAAGTSASNVLVWNVETEKLTAKLPHPQPVTSVTWDGTARVVAGGADGTVSLWSLPTNVLMTGDPPTNVAYAPDGMTLAVGGNVVQLWDTAARTLLASRSLPPNDYANATVFRPQQAGAPLIAVAVSDGAVELLNGRTLAPVTAPFQAITGAGAAESVAFSPDGRLLATGADDGTVRLFDVTNPARPRQVAVVRGAGPITSIYTVVFAPNGDLVAAASLNNVVQLWRVDGTSLAPAGPELGGMASYPIGLAFAPGGGTLAIGNADKHVYLWNVTNPARPHRLGAPLSGPSSNVWAVAFSPDGKTLAAGANDGSVWLWAMTDPARPALTATLGGLPGHVFSIAFSPDRAELAAASYDDDTIRLWDTSPAAARAGICASLGLALSPAEWMSYAPGVPYRQPCSGSYLHDDARARSISSGRTCG